MCSKTPITLLLFTYKEYVMGVIYKITNTINNKVYIGLTTVSIEKRWKGHMNGVLCVQLVDGTRISVYKCSIINKEFRIRK